MEQIVETAGEDAVDLAAQEYQRKENSILADFITGITDLGGILKKYRDEFKRKGQWMNFLNKVGISISKANAQIRMFEYVSEEGKDKKLLIAEAIRNWKKMNLFLSLPEDKKEEIVEKIESGEIDKNTTDDQFESAVRGEDIEVHSDGNIPKPNDIDVANEDEMNDLWDKVSDTNSVSILDSSPVISTQVQKQIGTSINSRKYIEGVIVLSKGVELLKDFDKTSLTLTDKKVLFGMLSELLDGLKDELNSLT